MPETVEALPYTEAELKEINDLAERFDCSLEEAEARHAIGAYKAAFNRDYESQKEPERLAEIQ